MKKALLVTSLILSICQQSLAQELVYQQDHGVSFNKGNIDADVLIAIIQEKQEELNKFVLSRIITKSWSTIKEGDSSRLDNFTTKYLIYETLNELTITADKSKFGKNTLELIKEASMIFGLAVAANQKFNGNSRFLNPKIGEVLKIHQDSLQDTIAFNQTLDMVLNACIENPQISPYFPMYGRLANIEDQNRVWYENDSRYFQQKDELDSAYSKVKSTIDTLLSFVVQLKSIKEGIEQLKEGTIDTVLILSNQLWYDLKQGKTIDSALVSDLRTNLFEIKNIIPQAFIDHIPGLETINLKIDSLLINTGTTKQLALINEVILVVKQLQDDYKAIKVGDYEPLLSSVMKEAFTYLLAKREKGYASKMMADLTLVSKQKGVSSAVKQKMEQLIINVKQLDFNQHFVDQVESLQVDYTAWKQDERVDVFDQSKIQALLNALKTEGDLLKAPTKPYNTFKSDLEKHLKKELDENRGVTKMYIVDLMDQLKENEKWDSVLKLNRFKPYFSQRQPVADKLMKQLSELSEQVKMVQSLLEMLANAKKSTGIKGFMLNETQVEASKELMNRLIDYLDKSGRFNASAIYLRTLVDNITYKQADSVALQPATISLSFESILYSLNDQLVKPATLKRTRYFQPYINIGVNYSSFLNSNSLQLNADGSYSRMSSLSFASEKIGVKFKIWNFLYKRSFQPGVSFKYYNCKNISRSWNKPQPKSILDDIFIDLHTGGLLYNVVNLKTDQNFNFPFVGVGLGCRSFNGITFSASLNQPYTHDTFNTKNLFFMFSIDIPIIEYINKLRSK